MAVLVTGAAGFIGSHVSLALLARGEDVVGLDNMNPYYDVSLKEARLARLVEHTNFSIAKMDVSDRDAVEALFASRPDIDRVVHLAAQAGVRHSLTDPYVYVQANVMGQVVMLEAARKLPSLRNFVYASSSSVYGANTDMPFSVRDRVDRPVSLYAATKRADELITRSYCHIYKIPAVGLRFFTVYGPWGRPDMAAYLFADAMREGRPIRVFNNGEMRRDFTYIDDIVSGILASLDNVPSPDSDGCPHRVYNLGNHKSENLMDFIRTIEAEMGVKAEIIFEPLQPGDVPATYADIQESQDDLGFEPTTPISMGIPRFIDWYKTYYKFK